MITFYNHNVWNHNPTEYRNNLIRELIHELDADVCTFQECGPDTTRSGEAPLPVLMSDRYTEVCPDKTGYNYTPVFYKTDKFSLVDSGYFLYDGLNDANSKSVTWALLEEKSSSKRFVAASTHFWWMEESERDNLQRINNARQLRGFLDRVIARYAVPIIVGGDFNNGENSAQGDEPYRVMLEMGFCDIRLCADESTDSYTHHDYPVLTHNGKYENGALPVRNLDYIFVYGNTSVKARKFDILTSQKALDSSDHCPLVGYFEL